MSANISFPTLSTSQMSYCLHCELGVFRCDTITNKNGFTLLGKTRSLVNVSIKIESSKSSSIRSRTTSLIFHLVFHIDHRCKLFFVDKNLSEYSSSLILIELTQDNLDLQKILAVSLFVWK